MLQQKAILWINYQSEAHKKGLKSHYINEDIKNIFTAVFRDASLSKMTYI